MALKDSVGIFTPAHQYTSHRSNSTVYPEQYTTREAHLSLPYNDLYSSKWILVFDATTRRASGRYALYESKTSDDEFSGTVAAGNRYRQSTAAVSIRPAANGYCSDYVSGHFPPRPCEIHQIQTPAQTGVRVVSKYLVLRYGATTKKTITYYSFTADALSGATELTQPSLVPTLLFNNFLPIMALKFKTVQAQVDEEGYSALIVIFVLIA